MKILIADDEALTRNGIRTSVDWAALGIDLQETAEDGLSALDCIRRDAPDILLTDVRMPRMDGIVLAEKYRERCPDGSIIFMSGYSDKPYLKSAIHLHAVSYLDKPISLQELTEALSEAVAVQCSRSRSDALLGEHRLMAYRRFASALGRQDTSRSELQQLMVQLHIESAFSPDCWIIALRASTADTFPDASSDEMRHLLFQLLQRSRRHGIMILVTDDYLNGLVVYLLSPTKVEQKVLHTLADFLYESLSHHRQVMVAVGSQERGVENAHFSLQRAADLMKYRFFCEESQVLYDPPETTSSFIPLWELQREFSQALESRDRDGLSGLADRIFRHFKYSPCFDPRVIKDFYYNLVNLVHHACAGTERNEAALERRKVNYWEIASSSEPLSTFHRLLTEELDQVFSPVQPTPPEHEAVRAMKEFIRGKYAHPNLSIKDISEFMHRSSAYLCTLFKDETGVTINQYITSYRIDRAKELLANPRQRITDIAEMVGYRDSNYFGKVFRAGVGMSPSEYRETQLQ